MVPSVNATKIIPIGSWNGKLILEMPTTSLYSRMESTPSMSKLSCSIIISEFIAL